MFNVLGPYEYPGSRRRARVYSDTLSGGGRGPRLGSERAWVVPRAGSTSFRCSHQHVAETSRNDPRVRGRPTASPGHDDRDGVAGGLAADNAARIRAVVGGEKGAARDIVVLNTGAALVVGGVADSLEGGIEQARRALDSGDAAKKLTELAAFRA